MAPSMRTRRAQNARQHVDTIASTKPLKLGKVSKGALVSAATAAFKVTEVSKKACQEALFERERDEEEKQQQRTKEQNRVQQSCLIGSSAVKRKRGQSQDDEDEDSEDSLSLGSIRRNGALKKTKLQLLTPPHSQNNTDTEGASPIKSKFSFRCASASTSVEAIPVTTLATLPEVMQQLASLHAAFVKALSLHYAHNGLSAPAEIGDLMFSMTRLWKKATVTQVDLQRMLAIHEVSETTTAPSMTLQHSKSPFKLVISGLGFNIRTNVEYCGSDRGTSFREEILQSEYEQKLIAIFDISKSDQTSFVHGSKTSYPLLTIQTGTQTQTHRQKMSSTRAEILAKPGTSQKGSSSELDMSKLSISDQMMDTTPVSVKSRTLSLFDRVRAKGVANSTHSAPTPAQLTRRHAIGRIPEIVEFLRMKQSQKSSSASALLSMDDLEDDSPSASSRASKARASRRVSFSLSQIIREVRESVSVPVSAEEVQVVITILATEIPEIGNWVKVFAVGSVVSVTLDGNGLAMSGREVGQLIEQKEQRKLK